MAEQPTDEKSAERTLLESLVKIAGSLDNGPVRQIPLSKFKPETPWNPTGEPYRESLKRTVYMSGARLREPFLSQEEISLLNKIHAGLYNGGRWVVIERNGSGGEGGAVDIIVRNKTQEDRIRLMGEAPDLTTLLKKIIAEYESNNEAPKSKRA
jgi:hypothetical protein